MTKDRYVVTLPYNDGSNELYTACVLAEDEAVAVDAALKALQTDAGNGSGDLDSVADQFDVEFASVVCIEAVEKFGDWSDPYAKETH